MKRVREFKSLFVFIVLAFMCLVNANSQTIPRSEKKAMQAFFDEQFSGSTKLKGVNGTIPSLDSEYCSEDGYVELVPPTIDPRTESIVWTIVAYYGGSPEPHPEWGDYHGSGAATVLRFYPNRVDGEYLNTVRIYFGYQQYDDIGNPVGIADNDYTYVRATPAEFNFGSDISICTGETAMLSLSGSETSIEYFLIKDGVEGIPVSGTGSSMDFPVTAAGTYTMRAKNVLDNSCSKDMIGSAIVTVNSLPSPNATNTSPVCEGGSFQLQETVGGFTNYVWTAPDGTTTYNGQNVTIDPAQLSDAGIYTLEVTDANTCVNTVTTNVIINDVPVISADNSGPICVGGDLTLSSTVTGGTGPYTYLWTHVPSGTTYNTDAFTLNNITLADAGEYQLLVTDANLCASVMASTIVVINDNPTVTLPIGPTNVCEGDALTLTATATGGSGTYANYTWYHNATEIVGQTGATLTIDPVAMANTGSYTVVVTDNNGCVSAESAPAMVVVLPFFSPTLSSNSPLCEGQNLQLNCTSGPYVSYLWTGPNGFTSPDQNPLISGITLAGAGTYTLTVVDAFGCSGTETIDVVVNPNPTVTAGNTGPVCLGGSVDITSTVVGGTGPYSYVWTLDGAPITPVADMFTLNPVALTDAGTYEVTVTDANMCATVTPSTTVLVVNDNPTVSVAYNAPVCDGATLTLTATPAGGSGTYTSYVWTKGGVLIPGEVSSTLTINPVAIADGGDYGVTVIDNSGCTSAEDIVTVVINALPLVTASSNTDVCVGDQIELYGGPGAMVSYSWTGPDGFTNNTQNPIIANATLAMAGTYTLEIFDGTCTATTTTDVVINEVIAAINVSPPSFVVCENEVLTFTANDLNDNTTDSYEYEFFINGATQGRNTNKNLVYTVTATSTIDVDVYNMTTGCSDRATTTVTMNPIPVVTITSPVLGDEFCENEDITITATPGYDEYVFWSGPVGSATEMYRGPNNTYTHVGGFAVTTDIAVEAAYATGCSALSNIYTVVINSRPLPVITGSLSVCQDATETYTTASGSGESNWIWSVTGGTITGAENAASVDVIWDGVAPYTISVNYDNSDGCAAETPTTETVTVNALPVPTITGAAVACNGTTITYTTETGMTGYVWNVVGGSLDAQDDAAGTATVTWNVVGMQSIDVVYVDGNSCTALPNPYAVDVINLPTPTFEGAPDADVCTEHTYTYTTQAGAANYTWDISAGGTIVTEVDHVVTVVWNTTGPQWISVNYDVAGCPAATPTVHNVTVSAVPIVAITGNTDVCFGDTETYSANTLTLGKGNYTWIVQGGTIVAGALDEESIDITWDGVAPYTVSLNYVNANGCDAINSTVENITVNVITAGLSADNTTICSGENVTFNATGGVSYEFSIDGTPDATHDGSDTYVASGLTDGQEVTVRVIGATGCDDTSAPIRIAVNTTPDPKITSGSNNVCNGEVATYVAEPGYVNYVWSVTGGDITSDPTLSSIDVDWNVDGAGEVKVIYESAVGCVGAEFTLPVTVNALPNATSLTAVPSNNVIKGTDITLTAAGGSEYAFFKISGGVETVLQARSGTDNLLVSTEVPSANPVLLHGDIVRVYIFNAAGCSVYKEITIGVYDGITGFDVIASDPGHCYWSSIASISLSGFQPNITYELFEVGTPDVSLGKVLASAGTTTVEWQNIKGGSPAAEFYVVAYYDGTPPTPPVEMNNRLFVEEYAELNNYNVSPTTAQSCGDVIDVTLDGSDAGVDYQLLLNENIELTEAGTGGVLTFAGVTLKVGTYTVRAVKDNGGIICMVEMNGSFDVTGDPEINTTFEIQGTKEGKYCNDGTDAVTLSLSNSQAGYNYELYYNNAPLTPSVTVAGTDAPITFGDFTDEGNYSVILVHDGCTYYMTGVITVEKVSMPTPFNLVGEDGGHYCSNDADGVELTINVSEPTISYQLLLNGNPVGTAITGGVTSFGNHLIEGTYTVEATTDPTSLCVVTSNAINVIKDELPTKHSVISDGDFCDEPGGMSFLHIDKSDKNVEYFWYNNDDGTELIPAIEGTGGALDFPIAAEGNYFVRARSLGGANCVVNLNDTPFSIKAKPLPDNTTVTAVVNYTGTDCDKEAIVTVNNSETNVVYTLLKKEGTNYYPRPGVAQITGDGTPIDFIGIRDANATYTVLADLDGCSVYLNEFAIHIDGAIQGQTVTSTLLEKCNGEPEHPEFGLEDSEDGVSYQLMHVDEDSNITAVGVAVAGSTGTPITFGEHKKEGTYYVIASSTCGDIEMNNRVPYNIHDLPIAYTMTGSGKYCDDAIGSPIGLDASQDRIQYQLQYFNSGVLDDIGIPVSAGASTGAFKFGYYPEGTGVYTVVAISPEGCTSNMKGSVTVEKVAGPTNQLIEGDAPYVYCADGSADFTVVLTSQEEGTIYELVKIDESPERTIYTKTGSGDVSPLVLGEVSEGTYAIYASFPTPPTVLTACRTKLNDLDGDGVGEDFVVTSEPVVPQISPNSDTGYCAGEDGIEFSVSSTQTGVGYQLIDASGTTVAYVEGADGQDKVFANKVQAGTYHVVAKGLFSGCLASSAAVTITESPAPSDFNVTIADAYVCSSKDVIINIDGSEIGINYSVVDEDDHSIIKAIESGTGNALSIPFNETERGEMFYTVLASSGVAGACVTNLGMVRAEIKEAPTKPVVDPLIDMKYCFGGDGVKISLTAVEVGVDYYIVDELSGVRISFLSGDSGELVFNEKVLSGTYRIIAKAFSSGCDNLGDIFEIEPYDEIAPFNITYGQKEDMQAVNKGEEGYGSVNVDYIGLTNSTVDVKYTLLKSGVPYASEYVLDSGTGNPFVYNEVIADGGTYTIAAEANGCSVLMDGTVIIDEKPLIANDTVVAVSKGTNEITVLVYLNDELESTVLDIVAPLLGANIKFSLIDPAVNPEPDPTDPTFSPKLSYETTPNNKITIDEDTGALLFVKTPSFYGRDSVSYLIYNTAHPRRFDQAKVHFFVGNVDVDDENNLLIPNAFSPNGDNFNDKFKISGNYGEGNESVAESKLEVYNRWGSVIYRSKGTKYGDDESWWDGTSNAGMVSLGTQLPSGTYFYVYKITINDQETGIQTKEYTGFIELRR